jgi:hypothetical protein
MERDDCTVRYQVKFSGSIAALRCGKRFVLEEDVPMYSEARRKGDGKEEETMEEEQDGMASIEAPPPSRATYEG